MKYLFYFFILFIFLSSCKQPEPSLPTPMQEEQREKILHIAHTRDSEQGVINSKITDADYSKYEMILLGGDLDVFTSQSEENMAQWDAVFDFSNENTLWTLGNHDTSDRDLVTNYTQRPSFYAQTAKDITFLVLDTQKNSSSILGDQLELVQTVTDTISESKYLMVLTHKLLWLQGNDDLADLLESIPNGMPGNCGYCTNPNNFYEDVYPLLVEVQNRGIEVICIAGDIGFKVSEFDYLMPEGIRLLASGLNITETENKVLEFSRSINEDNWSFEYKNIEDI